ncbi:unnamed protein product, partial [Closterium sp. Naga37s-1]
VPLSQHLHAILFPISSLRSPCPFPSFHSSSSLAQPSHTLSASQPHSPPHPLPFTASHPTPHSSPAC